MSRSAFHISNEIANLEHGALLSILFRAREIFIVTIATLSPNSLRWAGYLGGDKIFFIATRITTYKSIATRTDVLTLREILARQL
jgi:hypothetical protein